MGKKRIIKQSEEELIKEKEQIETSLKKERMPAPKAGLAVKKGCIYISSSYNNTSIVLTDEKGNVLVWTSAGSIGFKGTKKGTPFAASKTAEAFYNTISKLKIDEFKVYIKGIGAGRDSALRSLANQGLNIVSIKDITPIPHNGCRPPKPRRV